MSQGEMTVREWRSQIERQLAEARNEVRRCEDLLGSIDASLRIQGSKAPSLAASPSGRPLVLRKRGSNKNAGGEAIREAMLKADGPFNVPGIIAIIQPQFPDITYEKLSRRASAIAYRLWKKAKKIELVEAGADRSPNTYKRIGGK